MDPGPRTFMDRVWNPYGGILVTLLGAALTELFSHVIPLPSLVGVSLLLITLAAVAYSALKGGMPWGFASAFLLAFYTMHYVGPHEAVLVLDARGWQSGIIMLVIGAGIAIPMALIKRREDRLRRAVENRNRDLEERNAELTEANAALEAFGYVVSHDLKEPVRAIENYLEAAADEYGTPEGREYLETARHANHRLTRMLQGLLAYSRASSVMPTLRPVSVPDVLAEDACRAQFEGLLRERNATLDVDPSLPPVLGDDVILSQLLGNVLLNALRHHHGEAPRIRIRQEEAPPGLVHLVVEDNGPGFPDEVLQRFRGLKGTRPATVKGGFGLVISHRAAQRLGGRMWLENAQGGGARVHLELLAVGPGAKVQIPARPSA